MEKKNIPPDLDILNLITSADAARLRGVSRAAINYLVKTKRIRSKKLFGRVLVYRDEVLNYKGSKGGRPAKSVSAKKGRKS